jgi:hypothetical protein
MKEEDAVAAMKALKIVDDEQDEVIFDTGCTAHVLKCTDGKPDECVLLPPLRQPFARFKWMESQVAVKAISRRHQTVSKKKNI